MKILVIGASGRVGSDLVEQLLADNHKVVGTTRDKKKLFEADNYSQLDLDLLANKDAIQKQIDDDVEAIYFVAGSQQSLVRSGFTRCSKNHASGTGQRHQSLYYA